MLTPLFRGIARRFGARYDYDTGYLEKIASASSAGFFKLGLLTPFTQERFGLPAAPYYAAKFISARRAGCGTCVMLVVKMAEEAGVVRARLAAIARPGPAEPDMRLAADYAAAILADSPDLAVLAERVIATFGEKGRMGLAAAIAGGQFFPTLKRGLGAAQTCIMLPPEFREVG